MTPEYIRERLDHIEVADVSVQLDLLAGLIYEFLSVAAGSSDSQVAFCAQEFLKEK